MQNLQTHLAAPPRSVPLSLRIVNVFNGFAQIGWVILLFGTIFAWPFAGQGDYSFLTFRGDAQTVGRVTDRKETGASENERPIFAAHYQYSVAGSTFEGKSYGFDAPAADARVTVEYDADDPARSRIAGMRRAPFGPWAAVMTIFPLIGLVIVALAARTGMKRNALLRDGVIANGTLVSREETNVTVNRRRVWKLTFDFTDRMGRRQQAVARTTDTDRLEDEATEPLLYDPENPARAYLLDELPARPRVEHGQIAGAGARAAFALLVPAAVIGLNVLIVAFVSGLLKLK